MNLLGKVWSGLVIIEWYVGHITLGAFSALVGAFLSPVLCLSIVLLYIAYQIMEAWKIGDLAYIDIRDFFWGFGVAAGILTVWRVACLKIF
jgi:hypothetical protein